VKRAGRYVQLKTARIQRVFAHLAMAESVPAIQYDTDTDNEQDEDDDDEI
jgi:hypothetical protein